MLLFIWHTVPWLLVALDLLVVWLILSVFVVCFRFVVTVDFRVCLRLGWCYTFVVIMFLVAAWIDCVFAWVFDCDLGLWGRLVCCLLVC